jgi:hypothetical protein
MVFTCHVTNTLELTKFKDKGTRREHRSKKMTQHAFQAFGIFQLLLLAGIFLFILNAGKESGDWYLTPEQLPHPGVIFDDLEQPLSAMTKRSMSHGRHISTQPFNAVNTQGDCGIWQEEYINLHRFGQLHNLVEPLNISMILVLLK